MLGAVAAACSLGLCAQDRVCAPCAHAPWSQPPSHSPVDLRCPRSPLAARGSRHAPHTPGSTSSAGSACVSSRQPWGSSEAAVWHMDGAHEGVDLEAGVEVGLPVVHDDGSGRRRQEQHARSRASAWRDQHGCLGHGAQLHSTCTRCQAMQDVHSHSCWWPCLHASRCQRCLGGSGLGLCGKGCDQQGTCVKLSGRLSSSLQKHHTACPVPAATGMLLLRPTNSWALHPASTEDPQGHA